MAWNDDYRSHELWSSVTGTLGALSEVPADEFADELTHLRALLTEIDGHADQPHAALTENHLTTVKDVVDGIGAALPESPAAIFSPPPINRNSTSPFVKLAQYVRSWPATGSTSLRGLGTRAEQIEAAFNTLNKRIDERLSEIDTQLSELEESIAVALDENKAALRDQQT